MERSSKMLQASVADARSEVRVGYFGLRSTSPARKSWYCGSGVYGLLQRLAEDQNPLDLMHMG